MGINPFSLKKEKISDKRQEKSIKDEEMLTENLDSEDELSLGLNCNVVYVFPHEYNQVIGAMKQLTKSKWTDICQCFTMS